MTTQTWLYRAYDAHQHLLYVGITGDFEARMRTHQISSAWTPQCTRITVQAYPTREQAAQAEREAITTEHPTYNRQMRRGATPPPLHVQDVLELRTNDGNDFDLERLRWQAIVRRARGRLSGCYDLACKLGRWPTYTEVYEAAATNATTPRPGDGRGVGRSRRQPSPSTVTPVPDPGR